MADDKRVRREIRNLKELRRLVKRQMPNGPEKIMCLYEIKVVLTTLRWILTSETDSGPVAPGWGIVGEVLEQVETQPLVDFFHRMFEEDGRWPLERN